MVENKKVSTFTHLHCHTSFSLLDGIGKPEDNARRAAEIGQQALAITDHGTCAGHYEFQKACDKYGVKPILGNEFYFVEDHKLKGLTDKEKEELSKEQIEELQRHRQTKPHLILLAETDEGLKNIYHLNYLANKDGFYGKPRIDLDLLREHNEGIIATTTCIISPYAKYFFRGQTDKMTSLFEDMYDIFGKDRYFVELHPHEKFSFDDQDRHVQREYNFAMVEMFRKKYDIRCILANDAHYPDKARSEAHSFMFNINTNGKYDETSCKNLYIASEEDMRRFWKENGHSQVIEDSILDEAIETTKEIASRCHARVDDQTLKEPHFTTPKKYKSNKLYMVKLLKDGFQDKVAKGIIPEERVDEYFDRLQSELEMIEEKGYIDYFLITRDFCNWALKNDIMMSPGRGSASGSLLCWLLGITHLDPVKYDLFFERFLNPHRLKAPDIDNDFQDDRRNEVKDYVVSKWGDANVASCAIYSRYTANTLFREVCKAFEVDFALSNKIAKTISGHVSLNKDVATISEIASENKDVQKFLSEFSSEDKERFLLLLDTVIGNPKNLGVSAGGVIISSDPLYELLPLRRSPNDELMTTEWQIPELGDVKFLKIDMLGISTLTHIKKIAERAGMSMEEIYSLPLDREKCETEEEIKWFDKAYELLNLGETQGIFQFGGANITRCLQNIHPVKLEDIAAATAIYRPGVIQMGATESYLRRRNSEEEAVNDIHPLFDDILAPTEYIMIYQEQFIQMFNRLGLDFGKADILRRYAEALDKKKCQQYLEDHLYSSPELLALDLESTKKVADILIDNCGYLFNKSHAISYSILSYWTAYMKGRFPELFCETMINHHIGDFDNLAIDLSMASRLLGNPKISFGSINNFEKEFKVSKDGILIGLSNVKGLGEAVINRIKSFKPTAGWNNFEQFICTNLAAKMLSANNLKILIQLGMFDDMDFSRDIGKMSKKALCECVDIIYRLFEETQKNRKVIYGNLWGIEDPKYPVDELLHGEKGRKLLEFFEVDVEEEYTEKEIMDFELQYIGFRLTIDEKVLKDALEKVESLDLPNIKFYDEENKDYHWGIIRSVEKLTTKKGKPYVNVRMDDGSSFRIWHNKLVYLEEDLIPSTVCLVKLQSDTFGRSLSWDKYSFLGQKDIMKL
jgi:DNA polymerase III subunit alpha